MDAAYAKLHPAYYEVRNFQVADTAQFYRVDYSIQSLSGDVEENYVTLYREDYATTMDSIQATIGGQTFNGINVSGEGNKDTFAIVVPRVLLEQNGNQMSILAKSRDTMKDITFVRLVSTGSGINSSTNIGIVTPGPGSAQWESYTIGDDSDLEFQVQMIVYTDYVDAYTNKTVARPYTVKIIPTDDDLFVTLDHDIEGLEEIALDDGNFYMGYVASDADSVNVTVVSAVPNREIRIASTDDTAVNVWGQWYMNRAERDLTLGSGTRAEDLLDPTVTVTANGIALTRGLRSCL